MNKLHTIQHYRASGVTLIELMVVVVMVGILTSIAVPSYRSYMMKANRTDAKVSLLKIAAAQEKHYLQNNTYTTSLNDLQMEAVSSYDHYVIAVTEADATGFVATATAQDGQAQDKDCLLFTMNDQGQKFGGVGTTNNPMCWGNQ